MGVWNDMLVNDGLLRKFEEFVSSQYNRKETFRGFEELKLAILEGIQKEIAKADYSPPLSTDFKLRTFSPQ